MRHLWIVALAFGLNSCGQEEEKDFAGELGTCTAEITTGVTFCTEYSYTAKATEDPKGDARSPLETACTEASGTFSETGTCDRTNSLGSCTITSNEGDATVTGTIVFSGENMTAELAESSCSSSEGTFTAAE